MAVLWDSILQERVELRRGPGRKVKPFLEIEGCCDLVVEIVTEQSSRPFPYVYIKVGIPEVWIADLRGDELNFLIHTLQDGAYSEIEPDSEGWVRSPRLGHDFRLVRRRSAPSPWRYTLERRNA
jgi:Uma2 family endonuclease